MSVPPLSSRPKDWQTCFDAGMTLREAAAARVVSPSMGQKWARERGLTWPPPQPGPRRQVTPEARAITPLGRMRQDARAMRRAQAEHWS